MKKSFIFGLFAAALALVSCNSTDGVDTSRQDGMSLNFFAMPPVEANSRAALTQDDNKDLNFAYSPGDEVKVTNTEISGTQNPYYTFTLDQDKAKGFTSKDAKPTKEPATWTAYFPSAEVSLANQSGKLEDLAKYYLLMGTENNSTGEKGLDIKMKAQCAVLVIDNQKGDIDINVKCQVSGSRAAQPDQNIKWVKGLDAIDMANAVKATTTTTPTSLLTATETGTYYVVVPADVQLAIKDGDKVIKSTTTTGLTAGCYYNITIEGDYVEIGGKKWYKKNLGATTVAGSHATCAGDYYQWGSVNTLYSAATWGTTSPFTWKSGKSAGFVDANKEYTANADLPDANDVVKQKMGDGWRMPTTADFEALQKACTGSTSSLTITALTAAPTAGGVYWLDKDQTILSDYTGVAGTLYVDKTDISKQLFFPAAGFANGTRFYGSGNNGCYWASTLFIDDYSLFDRGYRLFLEKTQVKPLDANKRNFGHSIRPVKD